MSALSPWLTATAWTGLGLLAAAGLGLVALMVGTVRRERAERHRQYPPHLHDTTSAGGTTYRLNRYTGPAEQPAPYSAFNDEIGGSKRYDDGLGD